MPHLFDTLIRCVLLLDGSGAAARLADVAIRDGRIARIDEPGAIDPDSASNVVEGHGLVLSPGFIDVHTHDDTNVVREPAMTPK
ncbi:MAG TPA: D-aminoacylase, partial [Cupriavidus sp.]|nr:D-aminoacylase [Cupriavidus sp.]